MLGYFLELAIRGLRRNLVLTALMVTAVGVGIGTCMTVLTTLVAMSGNPIPDKSSQLYVPSIDVWGPGSRCASAGPDADKLPDEFTYRDATAFMKARVGTRQAAMYATALNVSPPDGKPFEAQGRATFGDFFSMFEVPFRSGAAWGQREDDGRANVVVLASKLADRVFPHSNISSRFPTSRFDDDSLINMHLPRSVSGCPRVMGHHDDRLAVLSIENLQQRQDRL